MGLGVFETENKLHVRAAIAGEPHTAIGGKLLLEVVHCESQADKYKQALQWIATVNACDYEYQDIARKALK